MDFKEKLESLLNDNMTERGFALWKGIDQILPSIWDKPTSSTGKYHKKINGDIPSQAEHTYQMLYATVKLFKMFNIEEKTPDGDKLLIAIALHDSLKYGNLGTRKYIDNFHDKNTANMIVQNKEAFLKILTEEQFNVMEEVVRFHSGRWSTDIEKGKSFSFEDYNPETLLVHTLDMMSTADLIQTDVRD